MVLQQHWRANSICAWQLAMPTVPLWWQRVNSICAGHRPFTLKGARRQSPPGRGVRAVGRVLRVQARRLWSRFMTSALSALGLGLWLRIGATG